ncbi:MAG TPA: SprB repeat-containing protein, partial [Bacteroidia bacterium]|nr:SprB repeat-containing protein [Bacteroidia bacterium]
MKTGKQYQPEDMEALLAEKAFRELYDEEKKFVLEHLSSENEYEHLRGMLLAIKGGGGTSGRGSDDLLPSPRVRHELLEEFEKERKRRALIWWNSAGLWLRNGLRFDLPVIRIAFASLVLLIGVWMYFRFTSSSAPEKTIAGKDTSAKIVPLPSPQPVPLAKNDSTAVKFATDKNENRSKEVPQEKVRRPVVNGNGGAPQNAVDRAQGNSADLANANHAPGNNALRDSSGMKKDTASTPVIADAPAQQNFSADTTVNSMVLTSGSQVTCNGSSNGTANVTATGGTPSYNYAWN